MKIVLLPMQTSSTAAHPTCPLTDAFPTPVVKVRSRTWLQRERVSSRCTNRFASARGERESVREREGVWEKKEPRCAKERRTTTTAARGQCVGGIRDFKVIEFAV